MMSSTPQSTGSLTPMSHNMSDTSWVHENSKCDPPDPLELDSQSRWVSIRSRSDPVPVTGLLHPGSDSDTLLLLLLLADMPKKSVMDSKSAKWLRSVCSVAADLLIEEVTIGVTADLVVVAAVSETATSADVVSWPLNRKLVVNGSITDLPTATPEAGAALTTAVAGCSRKDVTTSGSVCRMTSGGLFWGCRGWGCCCFIGDRGCPPWLTRIEVKLAVDAATVGRTWAEKHRRKIQ